MPVIERKSNHGVARTDDSPWRKEWVICPRDVLIRSRRSQRILAIAGVLMNQTAHALMGRSLHVPWVEAEIGIPLCAADELVTVATLDVGTIQCSSI